MKRIGSHQRHPYSSSSTHATVTMTVGVHVTLGGASPTSYATAVSSRSTLDFRIHHMQTLFTHRRLSPKPYTMPWKLGHQLNRLRASFVATPRSAEFVTTPFSSLKATRRRMRTLILTSQPRYTEDMISVLPGQSAWKTLNLTQDLTGRNARFRHRGNRVMVSRTPVPFFGESRLLQPLHSALAGVLLLTL